MELEARRKARAFKDKTKRWRQVQLSLSVCMIAVLQVEQEEAAIGFWGALKIPGVVEFSLCLFFSKLVSYTFLYWLPNYIHSVERVDASESAVLSTIFDVGGIVGGAVAGMVGWK